MPDRTERLAEKIVIRICANFGHTILSVPADAKSLMTQRVLAMLEEGQPTEKEVKKITKAVREAFPEIDQGPQTITSANKIQKTQGQSTAASQNSLLSQSANQALLPSVNAGGRGGRDALSLTTGSFNISPGRYPAARISRNNRMACDQKWADQISVDLVRLKEEEERRAKEMRDKRLQNRKLLDQQVQKRNEEKDQEKHNMQLYAKQQEDLKKKWEDDQSNQADAKRKTLHDSQILRQALLDDRRRKIEDESRRAREEGRAWAQQINEEVRQEEIEKREKKQHNMAVFKNFISENDALVQLHKIELTKEKQRDKEVLTEYARLLEVQEKKGALERAMQSKRAQIVAVKQTAIMNNMAALQKQINEENKRREERSEMELQQRNEREMENEEKNKELRRNGKRGFINALEDQLAFKSKVKTEEQLERDRMRKEVDESTQQWQRAQDEQKKRIKSQREVALKELEQQTIQNAIKAQIPLKIKV